MLLTQERVTSGIHFTVFMQQLLALAHRHQDSAPDRARLHSVYQILPSAAHRARHPHQPRCSGRPLLRADCSVRLQRQLRPVASELRRQLVKVLHHLVLGTRQTHRGGEEGCSGVVQGQGLDFLGGQAQPLPPPLSPRFRLVEGARVVRFLAVARQRDWVPRPQVVCLGQHSQHRRASGRRVGEWAR